MPLTTYIPCVALRPYVRSLAVSEAAEEATYKVLPGTGLVMGFQYKGKLAYHNGKQHIPLAGAGVTGLMDSYRVFTNSADTGSVLVFFTETGAAPFFKVPLHEIFGHSLSLEHFMLRTELLVLEEQLGAARSNNERVGVIEKFLLSRLNPNHADPLVAAAVTLIQQRRGNIRVTALANELFISQSAFERRFRKAVGATPKKFAAIVRMKNVLNNLTNVPIAHAGYQAGFYDQAHFIKEFKTFTGTTPDKYNAPE